MGVFARYHGHSIRLQDYNVTSLRQLVEKLAHVLRVIEFNGEPVVALTDRSHVHAMVANILQIIMDHSDGKMDMSSMKLTYETLFGEVPSDAVLVTEMQDYVKVSDGYIELYPLQLFARNLRCLLMTHHNKLPLSQVEAKYMEYFNVPCNPAEYGFPSLSAILLAIPHIITIKGKAFKRMLYLNQGYCGYRSPTPKIIAEVESEVLIKKQQHGKLGDVEVEHELLRLSPIDLLAGPLPSNLPSPDLCPELAMAAEALLAQQPEHKNLIRLETPSPITEKVLYASDLERSVLNTPPMTPTNEQIQSENIVVVSPSSYTQQVPRCYVSTVESTGIDALTVAAISSACISPHSPARSQESDGSVASPSLSSPKLSPQRRMRIAAKFENPIQSE